MMPAPACHGARCATGLSIHAAALAAALTVLGGAPATAAEITCSPGPLVDGRHQNAPPGTLVSRFIADIFQSDGGNPRDLGTNPRFTGVEWSTTEYVPPDETIGYVEGVADRLYYKNKTGDDLNRMADPPPSPFFVTATVSMENDEGQTVTGCDYVFGTAYDRNPVVQAPTVTPEPVVPNPPDPIPTLKRDTALAPPGVTVSAFPEYFFTDVGTNLRFVSAKFQSKYYYDADRSGLDGGTLEVTAKTVEDLQALAYPPPNPFWITVRLKVTNDEGFSNEGTVTYKTEW